MNTSYPAAQTALLLVDPFNDFMAEGGKLWPRAKETAEAVGLHGNMRQLLAAARRAGILAVFVPHRHTRPGDYEDWKFHNPSHARISQHKVFEYGSWGLSFIRTFSHLRESPSRQNTGRQAASPIPIWIFC